MFAPGFDEGFGEPPYALLLARSQSGGANFRSAASGKEGGSMWFGCHVQKSKNMS